MDAAHQQQVEAAEFYFEMYEILGKLSPEARAARLRDAGVKALNIPTVLAMSPADRQEFLLAIMRDIADDEQSGFRWSTVSPHQARIGDPGEWACSYGYIGGWPGDIY